MLPEWVYKTVEDTVIVSVLAYEAINYKRGKQPNYRAVFGKVDLRSKDLVGFPCKPRLLRHIFKEIIQILII